MRVETSDAVGFFEDNKNTPERLEIDLSAILAQVRSLKPPDEGLDVLDRLEKLGRLHLEGVIDDTEFAAAKARLLTAL